MDPNPYESPRPASLTGAPVKWVRVVVVDIIAAFFGAAAALFFTAPAGAIDGGGDYYAAIGALAGVIAHRLMRWLDFRASKDEELEPTENEHRRG